MTLIRLRTTGRPRQGRKFNPPRRRPRRGLGRWGWRPSFSIEQILAWADAFHERTGSWPPNASGRIEGSVVEDWTKVDRALRQGYRGLQAGSSLARLLSERRGVRNPGKLPHLTERQILALADEYHKRTG